ncbi:unnamed protein product [Prunus armeniaca]|uniref:Uncharacterized protein n=1 Tax=Prunus armeniaca TaxID=36596 RepID=A0A6J5W569_PRUAR|nr:unnamed protein product [Prunus armeniaca]
MNDPNITKPERQRIFKKNLNFTTNRRQASLCGEDGGCEGERSDLWDLWFGENDHRFGVCGFGENDQICGMGEVTGWAGTREVLRLG